MFCQRRKFGQGLATRKQTLFAASNQDADSCGERNTEQLASIDSVLVIDAQNVGLFREGEHDGLRFPLPRPKSPCNLTTSFLFLTAMTLILNSSKAF
jgi:hypothetical protein